MSDQLITAIVSIVLAIIGLAALATVLGGKAQTSDVIKSASSGLSTDIAAAVAPVSGGGIGGGVSSVSYGNGI